MLCFIVIFCFALLTVSGKDLREEKRLVSDQCLKCICNYKRGADKCGTEECKRFYIFKPFWEDAGKLTLNNEDPNLDISFHRCVGNLYCAALTIESFMQRYAQDCNGDGVIDCKDYVKLYYLGYPKCKEPIY